MAKKIEVDIAYLKSIGLSQYQISSIIKNSEPEHWTNKLPQGNPCYELLPFMVTPEVRLDKRVTIYCGGQNDPSCSFFKQEDADFIQEKCKLLIEMSNFSFAVNVNWFPDWNDKNEKKFGVVLQNGQARVSENELFNLYVFGIVTNSRTLALEMLEEFKERIETYFNKPFNSVSERIDNIQTMIGGSGTCTTEIGVSGISTTTSTIETWTGTTIIGGLGHNTTNNYDSNSSLQSNQQTDNFVDTLSINENSISKRKKRKSLLKEDVMKIQKLLLEGVPQKEIAEKLDYSQGTISRIKEQLGFKMRQRNNS